MKYNKRTDANQKQIVADLRDAHRQVVITNYGEDFPDLLVGNWHQWGLLEVKQPDGSLDRGQLRFMANAKGPVAVVTNSAEALDPAYLCIKQQEKLRVWLVLNTQETLSVTKFRKVIDG